MREKEKQRSSTFSKITIARAFGGALFKVEVGDLFSPLHQLCKSRATMDVSLSSDALDIAFNPASSSNLLATGLISGKISLIDYTALNEQISRSRPGSESDGSSSDDNDSDDDDSTSAPSKGKGKAKLCEKKWTIRPSNNSCRGVCFDQDGTSLFSISKDGSIFRIDTETGSIVSHWKKAHEAAPSRLLSIEPSLLTTGDDDGVVSLWDPRKSSTTAIRSYTHHFDWITSMLWCQHLAPPKAAKLSKEERERKQLKDEKKRRRKDRKRGLRGDEDVQQEEEEASSIKSSRERLVCTSGDGTLSVIDIRSGPSGVDVSEDQEDELLSIASVKQDTKLVVGTQLGILSLWAPTRGLLDHVDRIPGHPASVDAMCTLDHDTVLTGSSDGLVRVVQILPHKLLGIVADHGGLPVERLARKDNWLASVGHGAEVKLTDLSALLEDDDNDEDEEEEEKEDSEEVEADGGGAEEEEQVGLHMSANVEEKASDEDEEDSDSESESKVKPPPKKSRIETILSQGEARQDPTQSFFADL
jgi:WD40 repeat protein